MWTVVVRWEGFGTSTSFFLTAMDLQRAGGKKHEQQVLPGMMVPPAIPALETEEGGLIS